MFLNFVKTTREVAKAKKATPITTASSSKPVTAKTAPVLPTATVEAPKTLPSYIKYTLNLLSELYFTCTYCQQPCRLIQKGYLQIAKCFSISYRPRGRRFDIFIVHHYNQRGIFHPISLANKRMSKHSDKTAGKSDNDRIQRMKSNLYKMFFQILLILFIPAIIGGFTGRFIDDKFNSYPWGTLGTLLTFNVITWIVILRYASSLGILKPGKKSTSNRDKPEQK